MTVRDPPAARRTPWSGLRRVGPMTVALVALLSSGVAVVFTLFPGLKPDPGTDYAARVSVFAVERGVTFGEYLDRIAFTSERRRERREQLLGTDVSAADLAGMRTQRGDLVYVQSTVQGFKRRNVTLRWSLYGARSQQRVKPERDFGDVKALSLNLDAPTDRTMQLVWIPPTTGRGPYFVRVGVYDDNDTPLDLADSRPFRP